MILNNISKLTNPSMQLTAYSAADFKRWAYIKGDQMIKFIALSLLAFFPTLCNAQDISEAKLKCEGTYTNYTLADMRNISVNSIYIEISGDSVKVLGALGFDSTYSVINWLEDGLGIQLDSNKSYGGFLNRFSGQLSLAEKGEVGENGNYKIRQSISALCSKAQSLF